MLELEAPHRGQFRDGLPVYEATDQDTERLLAAIGGAPDTSTPPTFSERSSMKEDLTKQRDELVDEFNKLGNTLTAINTRRVEIMGELKAISRMLASFDKPEDKKE